MLWNASLEGTTVLVVDDEVDSRELTALVLSMAGAQVCAVASATEALRVLQHGDNYDVVITDIGMPVLTGYDLIRGARKRGHRMPMIALSAFDTPEHRRQAILDGFACYVTKPASPEDLLSAVSQIRGAVPSSKSCTNADPDAPAT